MKRFLIAISHQRHKIFLFSLVCFFNNSGERQFKSNGWFWSFNFQYISIHFCLLFIMFCKFQVISVTIVGFSFHSFRLTFKSITLQVKKMTVSEGPGSPQVINKMQVSATPRRGNHQINMYQYRPTMKWSKKTPQVFTRWKNKLYQGCTYSKLTADISCYISQIPLLINMWQRLQHCGTYQRENN